MSRAATRRTASRSRLLIRLRRVALPHLRVTVKPTRGPASAAASSRLRISSRTKRPLTRSPARAARKSARFLIVGQATGRSGAVACPSAGAGAPFVGKPVMRTAFCVPWPGGGPEPCGRRPLPCARGNRGGVCGPAARADKCVWSYRHPPRNAASFTLIFQELCGRCGAHGRMLPASRPTVDGLMVQRAAKVNVAVAASHRPRRAFHKAVTVFRVVITACRVKPL